ncbi:uncharacterized protein LOC108733858 [Agrilus planipennis]|uniref:Uncharacterized protein LOC108733858 n=1 Tax=Agrilus planipennis TaxID=224129 RepID=A0A7F5QVY3_AGRPL|nr:uncharacterized protein LOC108733858 [Agrilus planipennis]
MRAAEEYSELSEFGSGSFTGARYGVYAGSGRIPGGSADGIAGGRLPAEAEDALGVADSLHGYTRGRSGLYYSPPGTSYTIVERPSSAMYHHPRDRELDRERDRMHFGKNPRGTYLGSNPAFDRNTSSNKKRPISPEQVLRMFGTHSQSNSKLNSERPIRRSPASSPASTIHYRPPSNVHELVTRTVTMIRDPPDGTHGFGICVKGGKEAGTYLGSNPAFDRNTSSNKKRPISPEQVLRMFGTHSQSNSKLNSERPIRRSPASSPASTIHYRPPSNVHELVTRTVTMIRDPPDGTHGFGICVKGGKEAGVGVYISRVEEGSVAERAGLRPGDSILEVNGTPFTGISHEEALKMLKSCKKLSMTVRSPALPLGSLDNKGGFRTTRQTCSWIDRQGRPVSPPMEYSRSAGTQRYAYGRPSSKDRSIRRVELCIEPGQSLGLMIRGGVEYNLGIFITGVDKDSVADRAGLMVGDQILEVNGQSFMDVTHDEAVATLKYHKRMSLVVRDVGKVPHSCTPYDQTWDIGSPGSRLAQTTRKWSAALQMVEEKAKCLLPKPEFTSLCYYVDEYACKHMNIDAFVQVMIELLNTPEKFTLMIELREIVAVEDRARFDELVYRSDLDSPSCRDPRDYDYRHSRRKGGLPHPESNHCLYVSGFQESDYGPNPELPPSGGTYNEEEYRSPSEDSGLGMGISDRIPRQIHRPASATSNMWPPGKITEQKGDGNLNQDYLSADDENTSGNRTRRHSSPGQSRSGSTNALHQQEYSDSSSCIITTRGSEGNAKER